MWSRIKTDANYIPEIAVCKNANLWKQGTKFALTVWWWLCEGAKDWTVEKAKECSTLKGRCTV